MSPQTLLSPHRLLRTVAACIAAMLVLGSARPAPAQAPTPDSAGAMPFVRVPVPAAPKRSHIAAYVSLGAGAALVAGSFALARRADRTYDSYVASGKPDEIERLYDKTVRYDRLASGSLIAGEGFFALGLYLRFLRPEPRVLLAVGPGRCGISCRF